MNSPTSGRGITTMRPTCVITGKHSTPAAWVSGASARYAGRPLNGYPINVRAVMVSRLRLVSITPFGSPVVPPVPTSIARSSSSSAAPPGSTSQSPSSSRQTFIRTSSCSAIGA
jgi:hypothetical protein